MNEILLDLNEQKIELIIDGLKELRKNALDYYRWDVVGDLKVEFENYLVDLKK